MSRSATSPALPIHATDWCADCQSKMATPELWATIPVTTAERWRMDDVRVRAENGRCTQCLPVLRARTERIIESYVASVVDNIVNGIDEGVGEDEVIDQYWAKRASSEEVFETLKGEHVPWFLSAKTKPMGPWRDQAVCPTLPLDFFSDDHAERLQAIKACKACPVVSQCLKWTLDNGAATQFGVWGGMGAKERKRLRESARSQGRAELARVSAERDLPLSA